jgi:hypothetical protein
MPRWQRRTASTCPNAYYVNEGYKRSMHLIVTQNYDMLSNVIFIADAGAWPQRVPGEILAI